MALRANAPERVHSQSIGPGRSLPPYRPHSVTRDLLARVCPTEPHGSGLVASALRALLYECYPGSYRPSREGREWLAQTT